MENNLNIYIYIYVRREYDVSFLTIPDIALLSRLLHVHRGFPLGIWTKSTTLVQASTRSHWKTVLDLFLPHVWSRDWPPECLSEKGRQQWRVSLVEKKRWTEHLLATGADWIQLWEAAPGEPRETEPSDRNAPVGFWCSFLFLLPSRLFCSFSGSKTEAVLV